MIKENKILINGLKINYATAGNGAPLIFAHNGGGFWQSWLYQIEHFSKDYQVFAIDWPGFGESESSNGLLSLDLLVETLSSFIEELDLKNVNLIGNCIGGSAMYRYAQLYPNNVSRLIIFNICPGDLILPRVLFRTFIPSLNNKPRSKFLVEKVLTFVFLRTFVRRKFPKILFKKAYDKETDLYKKYIEKFKTDKQTRSRINLLFSVHTYTAEHYLLDLPLVEHMMIWGAENAVTSYEIHGRYHMSLLKSNIDHVVEGGGHLCMYEQPELVNKFIRDYLNEN